MLLCIGLTGCSAPLESGVLERIDEHAAWCAPAADYPDAAFGAPLDFVEGSDLTILAVTADGEENVTISEPMVMPAADLRFSVARFPPSGSFADAWASAAPAVGAVIAPGDAVDLVVRVRRTGNGDGRVAQLVVKYEQGGAQYLAGLHEALSIKADGCDS